MDNDLTLEIVEGPGAGTRLTVDREIVIGRAPDNDLVLTDGEASRHHVRITPGPGATATITDLDSVNGTFLNRDELTGPSALDPGDEVLVGVTVLQVHGPQQGREVSGVINVPAALASAPRPPSYVNPELVAAEAGQPAPNAASATLDKYLDVKVRRRAQLAPLALLVLIALALVLYFGISHT
jgi:predicted component of type VI protein secretion system